MNAIPVDIIQIYNDIKKAQSREYYYQNKERIKPQSKKYYHNHSARKIWEDHFKVKIPTVAPPDDFVIHHKDGDWQNNEPTNLLCMQRDEHAKLHRMKF